VAGLQKKFVKRVKNTDAGTREYGKQITD